MLSPSWGRIPGRHPISSSRPSFDVAAGPPFLFGPRSNRHWRSSHRGSVPVRASTIFSSCRSLAEPDPVVTTRGGRLLTGRAHLHYVLRTA